MEDDHYDSDTDDYYDDDSDTTIVDLSNICDKSDDSEEDNEVMQNAALRTATECTQDTNIQHQTSPTSKGHGSG